jgi:hypothetical protein
MGRTVSSFRIAFEMEEKEGNKPFRNALDRTDRKKSNDELLFDIPRLTSLSLSSSYAIHHPTRFYLILLMSLLLYCYKQLIEYTKQVEQITLL